IDPADEKSAIVPLVMPAELADSMQIKAGPIGRAAMANLVAQFLSDVRDREGGRGLAGIVHSPRGIIEADHGTMLANVLVPRNVRSKVEKRTPGCVVIVPDGALNELSFEALLLESKPQPKYLLDVFPPIAYAPSANILLNLASRSAPDTKATTT